MVQVKQAVILAGGRGTRLAPLTDTCPKPLLPVEGRPFVDRLIEQLGNQGIEEVVLLIGYLGEKIQEYVKERENDPNGMTPQVRVICSQGDESFETGKRLKHAQELLNDHFLFIYGDNFWEAFDLSAIEKFYDKKGKRASVVIYDNNLNTTTSNIKVKNGIVTVYDKTRKTKDVNGVEIGFFILEKSIVEAMPEDNLSFEKTVMRDLIGKHELAGFMTDQRYYSVGNHDTYYDINRYLRSKKTVFLDRDGVINRKAEERGTYIDSPEKFEFLPGVIEGLKLLKDNDYHLIIISNQAGIGREVYSAESLYAIHDKMVSTFNENDVEIDEIYVCPHDWNDDCGCRKPGLGMVYQAALDFDLALRHTTFVGDDRRDMMLAHNMGCKPLLVRPGDRLDDLFRDHLL